jgi:hypothetical protein
MEQTWQPQAGRLIEKLLAEQALDESSKDALRTSALRTLGRCGDPRVAGDHRGTHLVVGEVQSGKTLAFTTLMALARDNGFRIVIILAGTKTNLLEQTVERLKRDLLGGSGGLNPWRAWVNPDVVAAEQIRDVISKPWDPNAAIDGSQAAVCFVLKHGSRLEKLKVALESIEDSVLRQAPALIIDDEADQASPNLDHEAGERSPIYRAITDLRAALPRSDFLMYTATPQAPLLVELEDELSPQTVTVLDSGPDYVGGKELFVDGYDNYVELIPGSELASALEPEGPSPAPPSSLRTAIATFLLSLMIAQQRERPRPLSMLIHPAAARELHHQYAAWARLIRDEIAGKLIDPADVLFTDALTAELRKPYEDLAGTVDPIPPLGELAAMIPAYAGQVEIREVNAGSEPINGWGTAPGWILVGGNKLERGFTVQNLATTYMPRGSGVGNADTIQQRGRFFGYKREYLDICRGWFNAEIAADFADYVKHEESLRDALRVLDHDDLPLSSWRRQLLLSPQLRPTRRQVISLPTTRLAITSDDGWFGQSHLFDPVAAKSSAEVAGEMFAEFRLDATAETLDPRGRHRSARVPLTRIHELLAAWGAIGPDVDRLLGVGLLIGKAVEDGVTSDCLLVFMDGVESLADEQGRRRRKREQRGGPARTINIFQGRDPGNGYPGDRAIFDPDLVTVQLHVLNLFERDDTAVAKGVPAISVHLPQAVTTLILQD